MAEMPNISPDEFKRGYLAFQKHVHRPSWYKTATVLVRHSWGDPREMADGIAVLLLTWNKRFYKYGSFDFDRLEEALRRNMGVIEGLRARHIQSLVVADEPIIRQLFLDFLEALRIKEGKKTKDRPMVAVAKALHLLAPDFLPIWDRKIARAYTGSYYSNPDHKYVAFAYKMQHLARQLHEHVPPNGGRTFLKLIDEYNYSRYTKRWI
ncbi:MAG: hypothetical protein HYY96_00615 [Candidatus Tectomicrobia bacterium]|nr:hypothetical protein [Candidatus Tectomicrobia bacterium]